jgi:hypothetical protein
LYCRIPTTNSKYGTLFAFVARFLPVCGSIGV